MNVRKALTREGLQNRVVLRSVELDDESLVHIRALPALTLVQAAEAEDSKLFGAGSLLVRSLVDEQGVRLFADDESELALSCLSNQDLHKVLEAVTALNGLKGDSEGEAPAEKN